MTKKAWPVLGCGVGLRNKHYPVITQEWPKMDWFEAVSENYMDTGGRPLQYLEQIRQHYPIALHGTALSIGSMDPPNENYLKRLKALIERIDPFIVSDHLCWSSVNGETLHDLLPLPFTEEAIDHVAKHVDHVQNFLGRRILMENVSTYVTYKHSAMPEWEFLTEVARRSGCGILIDINNVYVNARNHQFNPLEYLHQVPGEYVGQIHLAGHTDMGKFLFDTHSARVIDPVWDLYREALKRWGRISTLVEWDEHIPEFSQLVDEVERARKIYVSCPEEGTEPAGKFPARPGKGLEVLAEGGPSLREVELWMRSHIVFRKNDKAFQSIDVRLNPQGGDPGDERLSVYSGGYLARIHESLKEVYETIKYLLGDEAFAELAEGYTAEHSSHHYNLNLAGCRFADFLERHEIHRQFPYLPDLARFEWLVAEAFHAFDGKPLDPSRLSAISLEEWEHARVSFQPSVSLLRSDWPLLDLWKMREIPREQLKLDIQKAPSWILIGRRAFQVRCEPLTPPQYHFIQNLLEGKTLGEALEALMVGDGHEVPPVTEWFSHWTVDGLITHCEVYSHQNS
ncbi:MAG TPA: DUF692 family protein [bacterium]|nr:DUF692 family protein [bacterium]